MSLINLNSHWRFKLNEKVNPSSLDIEELKDWRQVNLPHDWSIEFEFNSQSPANNEGGLLDGGTGYYAKVIDVPESLRNKDIRIHFGGIYMDSTCYINGKFVGNYPFGYNSFSYNINEYLNIGEQNLILIKVEHPQPSSRWYSGSGIYRDVDLIVKDKIHVKENGIFITTPNLAEQYGNEAGVETRIESKIINSHIDASGFVDNGAAVILEQSIEDDDGNTISELTEMKLSLDKRESKVIQSIWVNDVGLWSVDTPALYYVRTRIYDAKDKRLLDERKDRFGYRYFNWDVETGFSLNGQHLDIQGVCMHSDQGALGAVANKQAFVRQLKIMKDMGVNAIRTAHNPHDEKFIEACDELGLLVQEEAFDTWSGKPKKTYDYNRFFSQLATHPDAEAGQTWAEFDVKAMVNRDKNSPSIFMWSVGNEIWETSEDYGIEQAANLVKWVKELDQTRYVTMGEDKFRFDLESENYQKIADLLDIVGINYAEDNFALIREKHPHWKIYGSETASAVSSRGIYYEPAVKDKAITGNPEKPLRKYQTSDYGNDRVGWGKTASSVLIFDRNNLDYAGQFIWTGFDYIGEPTPWHNEPETPAKSSYFGIVDTAGFPKNEYYLYQSQWANSDEKMVHILPHWNWSQEDREITFAQGTDLKRDDNKIPVRIYSNASAVELFLNGESLGEKRFNKKVTSFGREYQEGQSEDELYLEWFIPWEAGELLAVAKDEDSNEVARDEVVTAGVPAAVRLLAETSELDVSIADLAYVQFEIVDANGNVVPYADDLIDFEISGAADILGVDNGNSSSQERYKYLDNNWKRRAFNGKGLVILGSKKEAGDIVLKASGEGLESAEIKLTASGEFKEDVLGYDISEIFVDLDGELTLPEVVEVLFADGTRLQSKAKWDNYANNNLSELGSFVIAGELEYEQYPVKVKVNVVDFSDRAVDHVVYGEKVINLGETLQLPQTAELVFVNGLRESHKLHWEISDEEVKVLSKQVGVKRLQATVNVDEQEYKYELKLIVNDLIEAEDFSMACLDNYLPELPKSAHAYDLLGQNELLELDNWINLETGAELELGYLLVGNVVKLAAKVKGKDLESKLSLRVTGEKVLSYNKAQEWNGSELPAGIASYTNPETRISALNNNQIDYSGLSDSWNNEGSKNTEDWAGILLGRAGELELTKIDNIEIHFIGDKLADDFKLEYYVGENPGTVKNYANVGEEESPLNDPNNWREITDYKILDLSSGESREGLLPEPANNLIFTPIETYAFRIRSGETLHIAEIRAHAFEAKAENDFILKAVTESEVFELNPLKYAYVFTKDKKAGFRLESNNNSVVIELPSLDENECKYLIKNEANTSESIYTIKFE